MITIGFNLEVDEGAKAPSPSEFADALAEALPKEWWADQRCDSWGVTGLFPVEGMSPSKAGLRQVLNVRDKEIKTLKAVFAQERKLTAHLERQLTLRQKQIADLEEVIADREATQDDFARRVRKLVAEKAKQATTIGNLYEQLDSCQADLSDKHGEVARLENAFAEAQERPKLQQALLRGYEQRVTDLKKMNHNQVKIINQLQDDVKLLSETVNTQTDRYVALKHKYNEQLSIVLDLHISIDDWKRKLQDCAWDSGKQIKAMDKIVFEKEQKLTAAYAEIDKLHDRGITLSDETLTDLEELTTKAKILIDTAGAKATDAFVILGDIDSVLDNIRTER